MAPALALSADVSLQLFRIVDAGAYFSTLPLTLTIARRAGLPGIPSIWRLGLVALWALSLPFLHGLYSGQTNGLVLLAIVGSLALWQRGHSRSAGLLLAAAALTKVYPGLVALLWVRERDLRALLGFAIGLVAGWLIPLAAFGVQPALDYLRLVPFLAAFAASSQHLNLSPGSVAGAALSGVSPAAAVVGNVIARALSLGVTLAGPGLVPAGAARGRLSAATFAWVLALMLIGGQLIEYHHLVFMLPAACLAALIARDGIAAPWLYAALAAALELAQLQGVAEAWGHVPLAAGGYLLLAAVCLLVLRRSARAPADGPGSSLLDAQR